MKIRSNMTVEQKVKSVAETIEGLTYVFENWTKADIRIERLPLPAMVNLLPVSGSFKLKNNQFKDQPNCMFAFFDKSERDSNGLEHDTVVDRCKSLAMEFIVRLNESGLFEPIEDEISYSVSLDKLSTYVSGIIVSLQLKEVKGVCVSNLTKR
ncbi:MAG: hypothetical protein RSD11_13700 [Bacteroides sp.]|uniref:hypothetical protein n=1 Tax=Bacteroides sp. TaxID=29523 RepID=UPI002FC62914